MKYKKNLTTPLNEQHVKHKNKNFFLKSPFKPQSMKLDVIIYRAEF